MGLDLLDIAFRLERELGISMPTSDLTGLVRDNDIVAGDLYELRRVDMTARPQYRSRSTTAPSPPGSSFAKYFPTRWAWTSRK